MGEKIKNCCTGNDSEIFEEWIAHCIRKHVKGGVEPKLTQEQCVAAAFQKLRKGELRRKSDSRFIIAGGDVLKLQGG